MRDTLVNAMSVSCVSACVLYVRGVGKQPT